MPLFFSAELNAILLALKFVRQSRHDRFMICSDFLSSLQGIESMKLDNPFIVQILEEYIHLLSGGNVVALCWLPSHVGIKGNEQVDLAAKSSLQLNISNIKITYSDFNCPIKSQFRNEWQLFWNDQENNKLHTVQPKLGQWHHSLQRNRRDELILCIIRIGHTYITHRHLVHGEEQTQCISCQEPLTVEHIMVHCADYIYIRDNYYTVNNIHELINNVDPKDILGFLREAGLRNKI